MTFLINIILSSLTGALNGFFSTIFALLLGLNSGTSGG
jgi:hypothetical protein